jgi:hypothetical protein
VDRGALVRDLERELSDRVDAEAEIVVARGD